MLKIKIQSKSIANTLVLSTLFLFCGTSVLAQSPDSVVGDNPAGSRQDSGLLNAIPQESVTTLSVETRTSRIKLIPRGGETFEPRKAQILIQSNILNTEGLSLTATVLTQAAGTAASIATGGIGGPLLSAAVKATTRATFVDEEAITYISVDPPILNEVIRFSECFAVERNRSVSSVHLVPSASKYSAQRDWSDKRDLLYHLEAHLDLNNSWAIADDTDEIVWVNYTLEVPEKFSFKTLEDLRLVSASGFILTLTLSTGEIEFSEMESFQRAAYTRTSFNDFLGRFFGNYTPPVPHPDCGTKSRVLRKLAAEIDQSSTLSDLEQFFGDLGVSYERDRSRRRLIGIMEPSAKEGHGIDFPVKIELSYTRRPRRFESALVSNFID